jgi:hypothetical protein
MFIVPCFFNFFYFFDFAVKNMAVAASEGRQPRKG